MSNQKNVLRGKLADLEIRKKGYRERHNTLLSGGMELDHMKKLDKVVKLFSTCVDLLKRLYKSIPKNAYQGKCINLTFKPSRDKKKSLQMCPLNLHAQLYSVGKRERDMTGGKNKRERRTRESLFVTLDADDEEADMIDGVADGLKNEEYDGGKNRFFAFTPLPDTLGVTTYDFVTFGAAAAHCMKFKKGGLYSLKNKLLKLRGTDGSSYVSKYSRHAHEDGKLLPEAATVANGVAVDLSLIQWFYTVEERVRTLRYQYYVSMVCCRTTTPGSQHQEGAGCCTGSERNEFLNEDYIMLTDHFEPEREFWC